MARLHLAENLGFADDQAVKGGGHGENMAYRGIVVKNIKFAVELFAGKPGVLGHGLDDGRDGVLWHGMDGLHLDPVTGRKNHRLVNATVTQPSEEHRHTGILDEQTVAQHQRTGSMVGADDQRPRRGAG